MKRKAPKVQNTGKSAGNVRPSKQIPFGMSEKEAHDGNKPGYFHGFGSTTYNKDC